MKNSTAYERLAPADSLVDAALADTRQSVFWLEDLADRPKYPRLDADTDTDLAIIGGGYTGLWTAILAKQRDPGRRVLLLEARRVGWAASGRNGGFCEASLTHGDENGRSRWPEEFEQLQRLGLQSLDQIEATLDRAGIDADFERSGNLEVATEPHQADWLRDAAQQATGRGEFDFRFLDEAAVRDEIDSPTFLAAIEKAHTTAILHPGKLVVGLAEYASRLGVEILENSPVRSLAGVGSGSSAAVDVVTGAGLRVRARHVALGTNAFPSLLKRNRLMTVPVYDYALMTEPLSGAQLAAIGWRNRQGLSDVANQFHYSRLTRDNRILFGGYDAIYHSGGRVREAHENRPQSFRRVAAHFLATFPQLAGIRFTHQWAGAIDTSTRYCAFFGTAHGGRVGYAAGFTGLGVGASRFAGNVMLDLLEGEPTERTQLRMVRERPMPFPPEPAASAAIGAMRWSLNRADHNEGRRNLLLKTADAVGLGFDS
ncbi:MAG: NAD(P)/FAD-dependent oxidoreductase, partial [Microbacteriaceae bacterium]